MTDIAPRDCPLPGPLEIRRRRDGRGMVLTLQGELDLASAPELERQLWQIVATDPGRILIDVRGLDFMDCAGISLIVRAQASAHANGHLLVLRRGPHQVQRLFQLTGVLDQFRFLD